ncbi:GntR family transcriptional regulator [Ammoniphilus sp. CFH 90114]|uniref:GntR family transcriptional regulator n=1 Tax=Ammoniphilus sp. CFH 90114 TaxID=2493665 RepID=UPI0013E95966|nr:GntR family transcriptional regulator [Ammoniphilus sp. CFH 90114]
MQKTPRRGTVVKGFTTEEFRDILEIRNYLELLSIDRMDTRERGMCLEQMKKLIVEMGNEGLERRAYAKLNYEFHYQLIKASRSEVIQNTYSRLASPLISLQSLAFMKEESIRTSLREHKEIVSLLEKGEMEKAKALLNSHNLAVYPRIREMKGLES